MTSSAAAGKLANKNAAASHGLRRDFWPAVRIIMCNLRQKDADLSSGVPA
jgi:hypothetical protein